MKQTHILIPCLAALLMLPFGCTKQPVSPGPGDEVGVSLALSVGGSLQQGTKMAESVTQRSGTPESFRGIERVYILPFRTGDPDTPVGANDALWDLRLSLPQVGLDGSFMNEAYANAGLIYNNFAHYYDRVYLRPDTDAVLVYGKAPDVSIGTPGSVVYQQRNGSLIAPDFDQIENTKDILFSPDPISDNDEHSPKGEAIAWKNNMLNYLNNILKAKASRSGTPTYTFNDPASYNNHKGLTEALEAFTNKGIYFPISGEVLNAKLTALYQALYPLATDASQSADYYYLPKNGAAYPYVYELAKAVLKAIYDDTKSADQNTVTRSSTTTIRVKVNGPVVHGLPAGTIPIQYQEGSTKRTFRTLFNIDHFTGPGYIPSDEICYPPSLWYYVNSPLVSTAQEDIEQKYTSSYSWPNLQSLYSDAGVDARSKAAAVRDPLQYGVALLELKCQKATTQKVGGKQTVRDFAGEPIDVGNTKFPLTGIIVADQYPQCYDFTATADVNAEMRYIYDAEVNDANGNARAWLSQSTNSATLSTLVLPTRPGADVRFALEFLNKTNYTTVIGANGCVIPPGQHFYLAGILKFSEKVDNSGENLGSVFVRGHVTEVKASFKSLAAAYDVIPDLTEPQLQLGVQAEFGWNLSTPTNVPIVIQ
jgi:hypothetical protein